MSRGVGLPVRVGAIDAGWLGLRPQIGLSDVRIHDAQGREVLVLPSIENVVAWRSLLHGELRLHQLAIDGPRLGVRRDARGRAVRRRHADLGAARAAPASAPGSLGQGEIVVRNAEIEWRDELRGAPPLLLSALNAAAAQARALDRARADGASAGRARQRHRAARARRGARRAAGGVERPRVPAARLHRPRRLAPLGGLPGQRAPGPGRAARVVERRAGRGEAGHRGPGARRRAARASATSSRRSSSPRCRAACMARALRRRRRVLRPRPRRWSLAARPGDPADRFPDRLARRRPAARSARACVDLRGARAIWSSRCRCRRRSRDHARRARAAGRPGRSRTSNGAGAFDAPTRLQRARALQRARDARRATTCRASAGFPAAWRRPKDKGTLRARRAASRVLELPQRVPRAAHRARLADGQIEWERAAAGVLRCASPSLTFANARRRAATVYGSYAAARRRARHHRPVRRSQPRRRERSSGATCRTHPARRAVRDWLSRRHRRRRGERRARAPARRPAPVSVHRSGERAVPGHRARGEGRARLCPRLAAHREHRRRAQLRARPHGDRRPQRLDVSARGSPACASAIPSIADARAPRAGERPGRGPDRRIPQVRRSPRRCARTRAASPPASRPRAAASCG